MKLLLALTLAGLVAAIIAYRIDRASRTTDAWTDVSLRSIAKSCDLFEEGV